MYTSMQKGDVVRSRGGVVLTIIDVFAAGGQGRVATAKAANSGAVYIIKQL